jgi:hypothetical protein
MKCVKFLIVLERWVETCVLELIIVGIVFFMEGVGRPEKLL